MLLISSVSWLVIRYLYSQVFLVGADASGELVLVVVVLVLGVSTVGGYLYWRGRAASYELPEAPSQGEDGASVAEENAGADAGSEQEEAGTSDLGSFAESEDPQATDGAAEDEENGAGGGVPDQEEPPEDQDPQAADAAVKLKAADRSIQWVELQPAEGTQRGRSLSGTVPVGDYTLVVKPVGRDALSTALSVAASGVELSCELVQEGKVSCSAADGESITLSP